MSNDALDLAFARHVRTIGLITPEQVNAALQTQSQSIQSGKPISVSEAFVQLGLLTPSQKDSLEKKVKEQQAGVQQLGPYKLMKKLGEGGMGAVYLALDPSTQRHVAVKVLPRHLGTNAEFVKRFRREAEAATRLKHPNIIGAFATGEDAGYHYYVMEYCEGKALDQVLQAEKQLDVDRALAITLQAARGLKYAHDQGIIHRDIKPSNIIVAKDGVAKILDLGLSKSLEDNSVSFKTVTGAVLGTPHYISPEQAQGEKSVDGRSDIYSLGATLYHLVTGQVPFDGATALEILSKHVNTVLPNPQDLREDISDAALHVLLRMMAKEPKDRYRDCGELIADLEEVSSGRTPKTGMISAALTTIAPSARRSVSLKKRPATVRRLPAVRKNKSPLFVGIGVAAAAAIVAAVMMSGSPDPGTTAPPGPVTKGPAAAPRDPEPPKSFDLATWEKSVAELTPEAQVRSVVARLKELNPGFDGTERHESGHGRMSRLELGHVALKDLSPLRAIPGLTQLVLSGTSVTDLSALSGSKLVSLTCAAMKSADLKSIHAMKELKILSLKSTPVRDLSPLAGMDLWQLNLAGTGATDFSPLRQVKLRELICDLDEKRDGEVLRSLQGLEKINDVPVDDYWKKDKPPVPAPVVSGPEAQLQAVFDKLRQLNPDFDGRASPEIQNGVITELAISALGVTDLSPLKALTGLRKLDVSGHWSPTEKREYRGALRDLGPLKGMKLESLKLHHTDVGSLEPLRGMKLDVLDLLSTEVADLSPIRGMPLTRLEISYTPVSDLTPLEGLPLVELKATRTKVVDFSPIRNLPLRELQADVDPQKHRALITGIKSLELVNEMSVADFLKGGAPVAAPVPKPVPKPAPEVGPWKNAVDLLALIDPARDAVKGIWKKENGRLVSEFPENGVLRIPYEPPPEYDFKIVFTRARGNCAVAQFLQRDGRGFFWEMAGWGNVNSGFSVIGGKGSKENPTNSPFVPKDGVKYTCVIQVRRDRVTALLDEKKISEWLPSMGEITTDSNWCVDVPNLIGLGNCESLTTFEVVQLREVTGKGRVRTSLATPIDPAFIATVSKLPAGDQVRRVVEKLQQLNPAYNGEVRQRIEDNRVVEFELSGEKIVDLWPIRALVHLKKLDLEAEKSGLSDIGALKGLKLQELGLSGTRVADLSALAGMPLQRLQISDTPVRDLSPLRTVPLEELECQRIPVTDFSPLKAIRPLKTINDQPAADFLKSAMGGAWKPVFDGKTLDFMRRPGGWKVEKGVIVNDGSELNAGQTTFEFENGDLRIRFEHKGVDSMMFRVRQSDSGACGIMFDGAAARALEGKMHELMFVCRGAQVTATLDGKPLQLTEIKPVKSGCMQWNATNGTVRISAIDFRAAP